MYICTFVHISQCVFPSSEQVFPLHSDSFSLSPESYSWFHMFCLFCCLCEAQLWFGKLSNLQFLESRNLMKDSSQPAGVHKPSHLSGCMSETELLVAQRHSACMQLQSVASVEHCGHMWNQIVFSRTRGIRHTDLIHAAEVKVGN